MKRIILEVSLKVFNDFTETRLTDVCHEIFRQWNSLCRDAEIISFLLWTAEGSEILEYRGVLEDSIEWAYWIGIANEPPPLPHDPERKSLHGTGHPFTQSPAQLTYRQLHRLVQTLKTVGAKLTGKTITVGTVFDPGPEFATSDFKYKRHPELNRGSIMGARRWAHCAATLHAEDRTYAGFPEGITEGTSLGTFLGRQSQHFMDDLGFDYIWFSNGFGYSLQSWNCLGEIFDAERFDTEKAPAVRDSILAFWKDFRSECPHYKIETRGSNLSTAMDLSAHAAPIHEIYDGNFNLIAPVNSPWAALNGDYGLELIGWLSHIAELPQGSPIPFRYYIHDPWWLNSPWLDRYGREPHDIYLPLNVSRLDNEANVQSPESVALLTIDDSYGNMPPQVANEVTPHLLSALRDLPDAPGMLTWIYPFETYRDWMFAAKSRASEVFFGDWFMRSAVNLGLPLNTVISDRNFLRAIITAPQRFKHSILLSPAPDTDTPLAKALLEHLKGGGNVFLYGPLTHADPQLLQLLGLGFDEPISGELKLTTTLRKDTLLQGAFSDTICFRPLFSGGGIDTVFTKDRVEVASISDANDNSPNTSHLSSPVQVAEVSQGKQKRAFAVSAHTSGGGMLVWVRGSLSEDLVNGQTHLPHPDDDIRMFRAERLMRWALQAFGIDFSFTKPLPNTPEAFVLPAYCRGGLFLSGYTPSTNVSVCWRFPLGVPLPIGCEVLIDAQGYGRMSLQKAWHRECRVFVQQKEVGEVTCREQYSGEIGITRRLRIDGLKNARVVFLPDNTFPANKVRLQKYGAYLGLGSDVSVTTLECGALAADNINGELLISW